MRRTALALSVVLTLALSGPLNADDVDYVKEALGQAGENRAALEAVLTHFEQAGDAQKLEAARFLIANMPGKGYIVTELQDKDGNRIAYDPLAYENFKQSLEAMEALEKKHGELEFKRDRKIEDLKVIKADFLIKHIDGAFKAWRATPESRRVGFDAFQNYILPYRGSQEPLEDWLRPLRERYVALVEELGADADAKTIYKRLGKDVHQRVRFNERFYLHPTDQGFSEMLESGQGRCEDITNMTTFAARSMALATAADYTPYWAHRDNNHAWNVLLDAEGKGSAKGNAHAAKIYRKTFAIQRGSLPFQLPEGHKAPNRFMASTNAVDVTDQYAPVTDVVVQLDSFVIQKKANIQKGIAYLCVFNGGEWKAIQWARIGPDGVTRFERMGRNICYLPAVFDGEKLVGAAAPRIVHKNGSIQVLAGVGGGSGLYVVADRPKQKSVDTGVETPLSLLKAGETYILQRWTGTWTTVKELVAARDAPYFEGLPQDGLYWLIKKESRRLERIFTIEDGRQRFW